MKQRNTWLDSIKFLGTSFIILSHAGCGIDVTRFYYVPIFFLIAGYVFKDTGWGRFIENKTKRLYIPFVYTNIFYLLLRNFLYKIGISAANKQYSPIEIKDKILSVLLFDTADIMASATWFVFALFVVNVLFFVLFKVTKIFIKFQDYLLITISILLYILGMCNRDFLNTVHYSNCSIFTIAFIGVLFYTMGYLAKKYSLIDRLCNYSENVQIGILSISVVILFLSKHYFRYTNSFREGIFSSPILLLLNTISGFIFLLFIAKRIVPVFDSVNATVSWAGKYSMDMLLWHVACFQLITFIQIKITGFEPRKTDLWPNLIRAGNWCYLAAFVGIAGPLLIRYVIEKLRTTKK